MLNELYTFAETCSGGPFFKSKMGEIYFTTYIENSPTILLENGTTLDGLLTLPG